jgi:hypothetical protein
VFHVPDSAREPPDARGPRSARASSATAATATDGAPESSGDLQCSPLTLLVAECLLHLEDDGALGVRAFCRAHPEHAREIVRRLRLLADHGLL